MSVSRLVKILILSLAVVNVAMAARTPEQIEKEIGNKVICLCGCQTSLNDCPHPHCEVKAGELKLIRTDLREGKAEPAILQDLVDRYGQRVLAAPPARGFNLAAWVLPGIGLLLGLLLAIAIVRRWRRPAVESAASAGGSPEPVDDSVRNAVEEEMKKYVD